MNKPKYRIGNNVLIVLGKFYYLVEITKGYSDLEGNWYYWTNVSEGTNSLGTNSLGWIKEQDILEIN